MTGYDPRPMQTPADDPAEMPSEQAMGTQDTSTQDSTQDLGAQDPGVHATSTQDMSAQSAPAGNGHQELAPMFEGTRTKELQERWHDIQAAFVDDPRDALRQAGALNDEIVNSLTVALDERKRVLELGIADGDTEQLRIGMRQYRQMLDQVLTL